MMKLVSSKQADIRDTAEQQARLDLAAAHRLAVLHGFNEGIFNHLTLAVPGRSDGFLLNPVRAALVRGDGKLLHDRRL
jgi:ribulose-5-phosphate 4-epimerase/fuculose-1-phosphate aldolase